MHTLDEISVVEFYSITNPITFKEHIHGVYPDGAVSIAICGYIPDYAIRKSHMRKPTIYSLRTVCRNCVITYEKLRRLHFDKKHPVMKRLINREMMTERI